MSINVGDYVKEYIGFAKKPTATRVSRVLKKYFETESGGRYAIGSGGWRLPYPRQRRSNNRAYIITADEAMQINRERRSENRRWRLSKQLTTEVIALFTDDDCSIIEAIIKKHKEQA